VTTTEARGCPRAWARFVAACASEIDIAWLAALRVLYGLIMCVSALRFLAYGWIDDFFVRPTFHFKYAGFGWVQPLSPWGMHALFWALAALALAVAAGLFFRVTAPLFVLGFTYVQLIDVATYLNHYYLASLLGFLLALSPAHRAWSLDARRAGARASVPAAWLALFRFQVGVVYTFAGLAKAHEDWLVHAQPLRIWLGSRTGLPLLGPLFRVDGVALAMSWAGFLFDTTIVWWMLVRRLRPFAFAAIVVFHALTRLLFPIGMFPVIMIVAALVFFPPSWPRRFLPARSRPQVAARRSAAAPLRPVVLAAALGYAAVQVAVPLRFLAYGGNVRWDEQGMRFSWRVMVREKNGTITFVLRSTRDGRVWHVRPRELLTPVQEREMSGQPDLILQLAHHLRDDCARRGVGPVEVRVDALVSLNGRRLAPLIDPDVDLARVSDGLGRATWVTPSPTEPPPHLHPI